jgi:excisionase family DNA binding protein
MSTNATPLLLTVPEVAAQLRVSRDTVYRKIQRGELPAVRLGPTGTLRIDQTELELYLYGEADLPALRDGSEQ